MMTRVMGASCVRRVGSLGRFEMGDERIQGLDLKDNERRKRVVTVGRELRSRGGCDVELLLSLMLLL